MRALALAGSWLRRLPATWRQVGALLDTSRPAPMTLTIRREARGRNEELHADFTSPTARFSVPVDRASSPILIPGWLARRGGSAVLVHGAAPGPYLLEFGDGELALLAPEP